MSQERPDSIGSAERAAPCPRDRPEHTISALFGRDSRYMLLWGVQLLGAAALTPLVTRVIAPSEFGVVATANAVMQILFLVGGLGLHTAMQRWYERPGGELDARRLLTLLIAAAVGVGIVAAVTLPLWSLPLGLGGRVPELRIAIAWASASAVTNGSLALLRSQDRLVAFSAVSLLQSVAAEAVSVALVACGAPRADMFLLGQLAAQLAAAGLALALLPPIGIRFEHAPLAARALRFGLPLVPATLATFVLSCADRLIIQSRLGEQAVAQYQIAYNVGSMPMLLLAVLSNVWMPRFFSLAAGPALPSVLAASRDALYRLLVPVVCGLGLGAPLVLWLWAPAAYQGKDLALVTAVVVVTTVPFAAQSAAARALLAVGETGAIASATVVASAANVVLNLVLLPRLGTLGSAVATLGSYWLLHWSLAVLARRSIVVAPTAIGPRVRLGLAIGVAIAATAVPENAATVTARCALAALSALWFLRLLRLTAAGPSEPAGTERASRSAP